MIRIVMFCLAMISATAPRAQGLEDVVRVDILPGWTTASGSRMAGIAISLAPGWKTYWRAPGDAGIPPMLSYAGSENIGAVRMQWPVPEVFHQNGMRSIGYSGQVILPLEISRSGAGEMRLAGELSIGVCRDICVPVYLEFDAALPEGGARDARIVAALVDRPLAASEAGVRRADCAVAASERGIELTAEVELPGLTGAEEVVIEAGDPQVWVSEPEMTRRGDVLTARVQMSRVSGSGFAVDRSEVRITILGRDRAVDIRGCSAG